MAATLEYNALTDLLDGVVPSLDELNARRYALRRQLALLSRLIRIAETRRILIEQRVIPGRKAVTHAA